MSETRNETMFTFDAQSGRVLKFVETVCRKGRKPWTVERIRQAMAESRSVVFIPPPTQALIDKALNVR